MNREITKEEILETIENFKNELLEAKIDHRLSETRSYHEIRLSVIEELQDLIALIA